MRSNRPGYERDAINLRSRVERQPAGRQRASCRRVRLEVLAVNLVKLGPFLDVRQEHRALHNLFHATFDDGFDVI